MKLGRMLDIQAFRTIRLREEFDDMLLVIRAHLVEAMTAMHNRMQAWLSTGWRPTAITNGTKIAATVKAGLITLGHYYGILKHQYIRLNSTRPGRWLIRACGLLLVMLVIYLELASSYTQAHFFSKWAGSLNYKMAAGKETEMSYPAAGPYDERLGYSVLPSLIQKLTASYGGEIVAQAHWSEALKQQVKMGLFPTYHEKSQAGLRIIGQEGFTVFESRYPQKIYHDFESIPPSVTKALLFIENRELLDMSRSERNPAVEWDRLVLGFGKLAMSKVGLGSRTPGASTLATQLVKVRHSPAGRTTSAKEKGQQMINASIRAYLDGKETIQSRKTIVTDYINSIPLGAISGYGELIGLGDGVWGFFGADFGVLNQTLRDIDSTKPANKAEIKARALAMKRVLAIMVGLRRPGYYLYANHGALDELVNHYAYLMSAAGVFPKTMLHPILKTKLDFVQHPPVNQLAEIGAFTKAANSIRADLSGKFNRLNSYQIDRLDLTVNSTLDTTAGQKASDILHHLTIRKDSQDGGVSLRSDDQPETGPKIFYSFTLYERLKDSNAVRMQIDTYDKPLNLNESMRLELGSTAKLRTLVTYLETITEIYEKLAPLSEEELQVIPTPEIDVLSIWVRDYLLSSPDSQRNISSLLAAAMTRNYSANPGEIFYTGGGQHRFNNFDKDENVDKMTVAFAFSHSVNLPFIRVMRDIVNHKIATAVHDVPSLMTNPTDMRRRAYLDRFASLESQAFIEKFYNKYHDMGPHAAFDRLLKEKGKSPRTAAIIFRTVLPFATYDEFATFFNTIAIKVKPKDDQLPILYNKYAPGKFSWNDLGYLTRMHPLELWYVSYMGKHPSSNQKDVIVASETLRYQVYSWLRKPSHIHQQNLRIRQMVERDAFIKILGDWQRLGYPFGQIVPSYATALGSSGDRPAALANLIGIIVRDGMVYPQIKYNKLRFGEGSPYETLMTLGVAQPHKVMSSEIAAVTKQALQSVVEDGTARRIKGGLTSSEGKPYEIGGKTGTGDNRQIAMLPGGVRIDRGAVNRTGTFAFYIGERWFGVVTAYAPGRDAANYQFTSALPVQILATLKPALDPLLNDGRDAKIASETEY